MKRRLLATILAVCMVLSISTMALAADGDEATVPNGEATGVASSGAAVMTGNEDGSEFTVAGDDDATASPADVDDADIYVWAKVLDSSTRVYKVDLAWGAMQFEFNSGSGTWNPDTHTYTGGAQTAAWTATYVDGTNNKIEVTNHSNHAVDATFAYAMDGTAFNAATGPDSVAGNFFADNTEALAASQVLTTVTGVTNKLTDSKLTLDTADGYNTSAAAPTDATNNVAAAARTGDVFFAFSGTPDADKGAELNTFKKVGVITVTVAPNTTRQAEYQPFWEEP